MTTAFRQRDLLNTDAAGAGAWYKLDSFNDGDRGLSIYLANTADSVQIQTTAKPLAWNDYDLASVITTADISNAGDFTGEASFSEILVGSWTAVRAVKTGTAGIAKVTISA